VAAVSTNQAGQQVFEGNRFSMFQGDLGHGLLMISNYGYTLPRFDRYLSGGEELSGKQPPFTQKHAANIWLTKAWHGRIVTSLGMNYVGPMFTNFANSIRLGVGQPCGIGRLSSWHLGMGL